LAFRVRKELADKTRCPSAAQKYSFMLSSASNTAENKERTILKIGGRIECMNHDEHDDTTIYKVVVNHEEQYSIWPTDRENALGWDDVGKTGPKAECLAYIKEVWTDMRPLSLRKKMEEAAKNN
jgi:MbtH protein